MFRVRVEFDWEDKMDSDVFDIAKIPSVDDEIALIANDDNVYKVKRCIVYLNADPVTQIVARIYACKG